MKKTLVVLAILVLGSLASAQTFGFLNAAGTSLYCDYEVLSPATAYGKTVWQGVHKRTYGGRNILHREEPCRTILGSP